MDNPKKRPNVRVRLILLENDSILLMKSKYHDYYYYPGGKVELYETLEEASVREVKEELDASDVKILKLLYIREYINTESEEHSLELFMLCTLPDLHKYHGTNDIGHYEGTFELHAINNLPTEVMPKELSKILQQDFAQNFEQNPKYLGKI
jgi:ADP-ribose pyrophosphatase YjhB (NUDIX family)